jgi:hypothetical protein
MKSAKRMGLVLVVLGMLIPARVALASHGNGTSDQPKAEKSDKDKDKKEKKDTYSVPEPTTIALLGAAAGVAGARKLWQKRRRSRSA